MNGWLPSTIEYLVLVWTLVNDHPLGCPICAGDHRLKRLSETDLVLSTQYPEVYAEMDPSQFKSVEDMKALSSRSAKNVHWTCSKHHYSYTQRISSRVSMYKKRICLLLWWRVMCDRSIFMSRLLERIRPVRSARESRYQNKREEDYQATVFFHSNA